MDTFRLLFGLEKSQIRKDCILVPLLAKNTCDHFGIPALARGRLYSSASNRYFTLIRTGVGPALAGDAVLHLRQTGCENIILFGSCGLVQSRRGLAMGSLVSPALCYSAESFTELLEKRTPPWKASHADTDLRELILAHGGGAVKNATCCSFGSLKLQEERLPALRAEGIDAVDMECASVFAAASRIERRAAALFYVSDVIGEKPFFAPLSDSDRTALDTARQTGARILCNCIRKKPSD